MPSSTTITILKTKQGIAGQEIREGVNFNEEVTWIFIPNSEPFQIVFKGIILPDGSLQGPTDPFVTPLPTTATPGPISGTVSPNAQKGLYLYEVHDSNNMFLPWLNPIVIENGNFGGLDIPRPPQQ